MVLGGKLSCCTVNKLKMSSQRNKTETLESSYCCLVLYRCLLDVERKGERGKFYFLLLILAHFSVVLRYFKNIMRVLWKSRGVGESKKDIETKLRGREYQEERSQKLEAKTSYCVVSTSSVFTMLFLISLSTRVYNNNVMSDIREVREKRKSSLWL